MDEQKYFVVVGPRLKVQSTMPTRIMGVERVSLPGPRYIVQCCHKHAEDAIVRTISQHGGASEHISTPRNKIDCRSPMCFTLF